MSKPHDIQADLEAQNARLQGCIADALAAMDNSEYGTARRILRTGSAAPPMTTTGVIAKDGAGA